MATEAAEKYMHVCDAHFTPPDDEREQILRVRWAAGGYQIGAGRRLDGRGREESA